ncbi:MAG: amidohydrolase family protein, partial [Pseudomonadota bacterium]
LQTARSKALKDPAFRERLLNDEPDAENPFVRSILRSFGKMFVLGDPPDYEPTADKTVAAIAAARGTSPEAVALDLMMEGGGKGMLYLPFLNYAQGSLDPVKTMLESPASLPGLSDGGAHVGMICDGSFPTTLLTHWARDRSRGETIPLEFLIQRQCRDTAAWVGLKDRGVLAPGYRADLNVIDFDNLTLHAPYITHDLPAGGRRLMQKADGYEATVVAGQMIQRYGEATGAKPGRLVRGAKAA